MIKDLFKFLKLYQKYFNNIYDERMQNIFKQVKTEHNEVKNKI